LAKVLKRLHYPLEVILTCVRWFVAYPLSLRHLEEAMAERGTCKMHGYLDEMQQAARRLSLDGAAGAHSETVGSDLRHAILVLGKDLADLGVLMGQVQYYARHMSYLAVQAVAFGEEVAQKIVTHLRDNNRQPPAAWVAVLAELRSYRGRLHELR
jgi:hypothetical protein